MNNTELMNVLSLASKSKTNKEISIYMGAGLVLFGLGYIYFLRKNKKLTQSSTQNRMLISEMNNRIGSIQHENSRLMSDCSYLMNKFNQLLVEFQKEKSDGKQDSEG